MAVLRKTNSHSADICKLIKNKPIIQKEKRKLIQTLIFTKCSLGIKKKKYCEVHIIKKTHFTPKNTIKDCLRLVSVTPRTDTSVQLFLFLV